MDRAAPIGPGAFVAVVGPSGAGKDTLIALARRAFAARADVVFARRVVTRPSDGSEEHDTATPAAFAAAAAAGAFALAWHAHGHGYGLPAALDDHVRAGRVVVANVSREVVATARLRYRTCRVVLVTAPHEVLAARRLARHRASDDGGAASRAGREQAAVVFAAQDVTIVNDAAPEAAAAALVAVLEGLRQAPA